MSGILKESESEWTIKDGSHVDTWYFKKNLNSPRPPKMIIKNVNKP